MFFDVETTGLLKKNTTLITHQPYVIQLCFVIYDSTTKTELRTYDKYIHIDPDVQISQFISELTGITRENCDSGVYIQEALAEFIKEYLLCETVVAHNINFDRDMIRIELCRSNVALLECGMVDITRVFNELYERINKKKIYCTMTAGKDICALWVKSTSTTRSPYKKFPKLGELHNQLFGFIPIGMHNALADTMACMKCYIALEQDKGVTESSLTLTRAEIAV